MSRLISLLVLLAATPCWGATYYVDYLSGDNTNSGAATATPFKHCPGDYRASDNAAITLQPGDTVYFKGGVAYTGTGTQTLITVNGSGSATSFITYDGTGTGWGSGHADIDMADEYEKAFYASAKDYVTIQGFHIYAAQTNIAGDGDASCSGGDEEYVYNLSAASNTCVAFDGRGLTTSYGLIHISGDSDHWTIDSVTMNDTENWELLCVENAQTDSHLFNAPGDQAGIYLSGANPAFVDDVTITNCVISQMESAIIAFWANSVLVDGNNIGGTSGTLGYFSVAGKLTQNSTNFTISDNTIHDGWQYEGDDSLQRCHEGDWFHIFGTVTPPHDITIERNFLYNNKAFTKGFGTSNGVYPSDGAYNITFRNNVIANAHPVRSIYMPSSGTSVHNVKVHNNTIVEWAKDDTDLIHMYVGDGMGSTLEFYNNLLYVKDTGGQAWYDYDGTWQPSHSSDYNFYYSDNATPFRGPSATYMNLATWKTYTGGEANSIGLQTDPVFTSLPVTGATAGSGDYTLQSGSSAIGAGTNLSSNFTIDISGNTRSAWDIGAYEYIAPTTNTTGAFSGTGYFQ